MTSSTERGPENFFGELYLRSTRPFLPEHVSDADAGYLVERLTACGVTGPVLDLGCGHGRHLRRVNAALGRRAVGVDFDALSLTEAKAGGAVARGSFFRLPFRANAFEAAWCWYNTLGTFEDAAVPGILSELSRCVRPGGWFIVHGSSPVPPTHQPEASYDGVLDDGARLKEQVRFNPAKQRDELTRELTLPDGRFMAASFFIRYYAVPEWEALLDAAGFQVQWVHGAVDGSALNDASVDQIVGAQKRG